MRILMLLFVAVAAVHAQTNDFVKIRVTGDRVSLRAKPDLNGDLLDRAMRGEEMAYFEKTNGWVAVQAPDSLDFWVAAVYVQNGVIQPEKLNVRSGPSRNYSVVAVLSKGDAVSLRGEFNDWLKIAPPQGSRVWISEDFVEFIEPPKPPPMIEAIPEPELVVEPAPDAAIETLAASEPITEAGDQTLPPLILVMEKSKPQGKYDEIPGVLRRANPGLYKLVLIADGFEEPICLVRGKESQMERYLNRSMLLKGKVYWAKDIDLPIIQPEKIHLDPILSD
jgi:hypothetical protein